jgi:hypothetical protein
MNPPTVEDRKVRIQKIIESSVEFRTRLIPDLLFEITEASKMHKAADEWWSSRSVRLIRVHSEGGTRRYGGIYHE